ncbi:hypothetical protein SUGI_1486020 [Cryptomeria japonica]|uniref:SHSP domain-containing protein n=1 Tax=Cryptomeria japonica TaxID=3369 RepID=A0AAD3NSD3_CRYJA|nr:18.1 kDa class I heat shock protein-like [Cryptomeria japonica]XP_059072048.1 18.1 kDa class I heat shock protein-like [Cryptomeria japonica]XP_059072068.1 18.1 kDa class I heat shock protein-like [Cryptomeria japonica]GLJ58471.1 hypothetical protein SUGI_1451030 [Cryptomeria japonica]GLJ58865.1 hypothetical protein SUGI_1481080 [Cryptomeria japonica]GLJ58948.1 hypothetical protein SUGI_1486020 [Cryptomeria japonica]
MSDIHRDFVNYNEMTRSDFANYYEMNRSDLANSYAKIVDPRYKMPDSFVSWKETTTFPPVDWNETADTHVFKADLAGEDKAAVKLGVVDGRILEISGERSIEGGKNYLRCERFKGRFLRRFTLPENAKVDEVKAGMENGVLTVTVPKQPDTQALFRDIEIC